MRVMQRGISIILPGKMAEAMELSKQLVAILDRVGFPPFKIYQPYAGGADVMHTIIFEGEWDSFTTMGTRGLRPQRHRVIESSPVRSAGVCVLGVKKLCLIISNSCGAEPSRRYCHAGDRRAIWRSAKPCRG